ncbi:hypothetical protein SAMN05216360_1185 [Methylobacterium phyllostachyos]|uniref:Uncharacterized protein n=1 Tax=Methylobacterium phyllostachyos TaxID=582672 RepID=A0A1H0I4J2_9HYPH|nr:hypothetical protein SAMN05216360_1185 [Methylobacterium phyllostachyos]
MIAAVSTALVLGASASAAASDITIAAIATGRLYVLGRTEHPHTTVVLDDQFRTESDQTGKFQYELVYHPARCIVSAAIDGKTYEAAVSNCGEQCQPTASEQARPMAAAVPSPDQPTPATASRSSGEPNANRSAKATPPSGAAAPPPSLAGAAAGVATDSLSLPSRNASPTANDPGRFNAITNPPLPPARPHRPAPRSEAATRVPRPLQPQKPKPTPRQDQDDPETVPLE